MSTTDDLIAKALRDRAATVTQSNLERPDLLLDPVPGDRRDERARRRWASRTSAVLAAAASVVAVLAIVVAITSLRAGTTNHHPASGGASAALTGVRWQLTGVQSAAKTGASAVPDGGPAYPIPATYRAEFEFDTDGRVSGLDGPNALGGTYRTVGNKLTIRITTAGTAGGTSTSPALEAMSSTYTPASVNDDSVTSTYALSPGTLVLETGRWTVTFSARAANSTHGAPASATSTK